MTSTYNTKLNTIQNRVKTLVADVLAIEFGYMNQPFTKPDNSPFGMCNVLFGEAFLAELPADSGKREETGVLIVQLFAPIEKGTGTVMGYADTVVDAFDNVTVDGVTYQTPYPSNPARDGTWWQVNVNCPFFAYRSP